MRFFGRSGFFLFFLFFLCTSPVSAQIKPEAVTGEDIAIAFFKTADTNPDFELWAKGSRSYKVSAPALAGGKLEIEKQRLIKLWQDFSPEEDVLDIEAKVDFEIKKVTSKEGTEKYWLYIIFKNKGQIYFPYTYLDYKFAVIPQKIESLTIQPLQKEQYQKILLASNGVEHGAGKLFIQLKPLKAYIHQPYMIDGVEQWSFLCDVATMSLANKKGSETFWTYGAQWYLSPITQDLQDLYKAPREGDIPATP